MKPRDEYLIFDQTIQPTHAKRTLEAVTTLGLLADDIENGVDELSTLGVIYEKATSARGNGHDGFPPIGVKTCYRIKRTRKHALDAFKRIQWPHKKYRKGR